MRKTRKQILSRTDQANKVALVQLLVHFIFRHTEIYNIPDCTAGQEIKCIIAQYGKCIYDLFYFFATTCIRIMT